MSTQMIREPATTLMPALDGLVQCHKNYEGIVAFLDGLAQEKKEEIGAMERNMGIFLGKAEEIVRELSLQVGKLEKIKNEQDKIVENKRPMSKSKDDKRNQTAKKPNNPGVQHAQRMTYEQYQNFDEQVQNFHKNIFLKRQNEVKQRLKRNPKISQFHLYFNACQKGQESRLKYHKNGNFAYCRMCTKIIRSQRGNVYLIYHFKDKHKDTKYGTHQFYKRKDFYEMTLESIEKGEMTLYKCNCMAQEFNSQSEYVSHIAEQHGGEVPPYSSHLLTDQGSVVLNPQYGQQMVLEQLMVGQFYYCGICKFNFNAASSLYQLHMRSTHHGVANEECSHFLKTPVETKRKQRKVHAEKPQQKIVFAKKRREEILVEHQQLKIPRRTKQVHPTEHLKNISEDEHKFLKIIENYRGSYTCLRCNKPCNNYSELEDHILKQVSKPNQSSHFYDRQSFLKIAVHKSNFKLCNKYFLPLDLSSLSQEIKEMQLQVPIRHGKIIERKSMTYKQFVNYLISSPRIRGGCTINYNFSWYLE